MRLLLLLLLSAPAFAVDKDNPFDAELKTARVELAPGASATVEVQYRVLKDHYIYRDMSDVWAPDGSKWSFAPANFPKGEVKHDKISDSTREIYHHDFVVSVAVTAPKDAAPGATTLDVQAKWQGCNEPEQFCLFPTTKTLSLPVTIQGGAGAGTTNPEAPAMASAEGASPGTEAPPASPTESSLAGLTMAVSKRAAGPGPGTPATESCAGSGASGNFVDRFTAWITGMIQGAAAGGGLSLALLALVYLGGVGSSLTPCVYPMIPITMSVIGASGDEGRLRSFLRSLVYVGGICVTYSSLGLFAAMTGGMFGAALQNPWVLGGISAFMFVMAAAMFGAYEFALPESWTQRASMAGSGGGWLGSFVVGTVAGVVAAPCTGPVVAFLLPLIAAMPPYQATLVMVAYSVGLGTLFLVLGTFAGAISSLPRSGGWMVTVKHVFGLVITAAGLYFLDKALPDGPMMVLWALFVAGAAFTLAGAMDVVRGPRSVPRLALGAATLGLGLLGVKSSYLSVDDRPSVSWSQGHDAGLASAATAGKPMLLDFTADWCQACKELEHITYRDPAVVTCSAEFVPVMYDATKETSEFTALRGRYGFKGLPAVFFMCPKGELLDDLTLTGFEPPDRFLEKMNRAIHACRAS
jgi:thiol:disulfide interchange protein DsbD